VELPIAKDQRFFRDLLAVSSGTWASLSGIANYSELSVLESDIAIFYLYHQEGPYDSWVDVWNAYREAVVAIRAEELMEHRQNIRQFGLPN
jgi:hypothetical protein